MSMMKNLPSRKKANILLNLKKYSNVTLFSRREEENIERNNTSIKSNKKIKNKNKNNKNDIKLSTPLDDLSTYALKTISSFKTTFNSISSQILFPQSSKVSIIDKKENSKNYKPYLTISSFRTENNKNLNITPKKSIFCLKQNFSKPKNNLKDNQRLNTTSNLSLKNYYTIREKQNEINLLKQIKGLHTDVSNKKLIRNNEEYLLNLKLKKLESEKYNISLNLNKVREFKYSNYLNEQRKEINKTSIENSKNNLEFLTDKINTLNMIKNIYSIKISNKVGEYSKFILKYKEKEKIISDILLNQINSLKRDVKNLQNKIAKKEYEKSQILKWIYFLIKMKEKKLILPTYYKKIIETNFERKKIKRKTIVLNIDNLKILHQHEKRLIFSNENKPQKKDYSNKLIEHIRLINYNNDGIFDQKDKNKYIESKFKNKKLKLLPKSTISFKKRSSIKTNLLNTNENNTNQIFNFDESFETNKKIKKTFDKLIQDGITSNEINRISHYKLYLIYQTPDELEDRLNELQNENIQLLHQYEISRKKLFAKKLKYKDLFENKIGLDSEDINNKIKFREIRLNQLKKKNENFLKQYDLAIKSLPEKKSVNIKPKKNLSLRKNSIIPESKRKELLTKIEKIFDLCINNVENPSGFEEYKQKSKDIISMLTVIELFVVILKSKLNFKDKGDILKYDLMKKIKNRIENEHKIEKGIILRLKEKEKFQSFQENIEEKMNKILFLQKRKTVPLYKLNNNKKKKNVSVEKKLNFEDFMFD